MPHSALMMTQVLSLHPDITPCAHSHVSPYLQAGHGQHRLPALKASEYGRMKIWQMSAKALKEQISLECAVVTHLVWPLHILFSMSNRTDESCTVVAPRAHAQCGLIEEHAIHSKPIKSIDAHSHMGQGSLVQGVCADVHPVNTECNLDLSLAYDTQH